MSDQPGVPELKRFTLTKEARAIIEKLPAPDIITILEGLTPIASNNEDNNVNNNALGTQELGREELIKALDTVPTELLRTALRSQKIIP